MTSQKYSLILEVNAPADGATVGRLQTGQTFALSPKGKRRLDCASGSLWVTIENDPVDYILDAGMGLDLVRPGKVVVSALNRSSYTLA